MDTTENGLNANLDSTLQELTPEEQKEVQGGYGIIIRRRAYEG